MNGYIGHHIFFMIPCFVPRFVGRLKMGPKNTTNSKIAMKYWTRICEYPTIPLRDEKSTLHITVRRGVSHHGFHLCNGQTI